MVLEWILENYIEIAASVIGIIGVWLTAKENILCWPAGLINVILSLYVFFNSRLYADVLLQVFYLVMTLYGWYNWLYGGEKRSKLKIRKINKTELISILIIGFTAAFITGWLFSRFTNASLPYIDSLVFVWGVIGTWAMGRKIIEHWIIWIINDLICVGIYAYKELYAFTILYLIFSILAVYGLLTWKKQLNKILI